jgi:hypothetical protein
MQRRIEAVSINQLHTLVIQSGAVRRCLRFNVPIKGLELRQYCHEQFGWQGLDSLQMTVDGQVFQPAAVADLELKPEVSKVEFGSCQAKVVEFRRPAPAKG